MKKNNNSGAESNGKSRILLWPEICIQLCRLGGFTAQLDGDRLHIKLKHRQLLKKFEEAKWFGWVSPELCCRFVPEYVEQVFWGEKEQYEKKSGRTFPSGDAPVNTLYESRGRLTIPAQLMVCSGIEASNEVFCMPRSRCIEVWKPGLLTAYVASNGMTQTPRSNPSGQIPQNSTDTAALPASTR